MAAGIVKFCMGNGYNTYIANKNSENWEYKDALFFNTNTKTIYLNGEPYSGGSGSVSEELLLNLIASYVGTALESVEKTIGTQGEFIYTFTDLNGSEELKIIIPRASDTTDGLMTTTLKSRLEQLDPLKIVFKDGDKGLSSNDLTDELLEKLQSAEENIINQIKLDGDTIAPVNKVVDIKISDKVKDLINIHIGKTYTYKGSKENASNLPTEGNAVGDVYNIINSSIYGAPGVNVAWTEDGEWDSLGGVFSTEDISQRLGNLENNYTGLDLRVTNLEKLNIGSSISGLQDLIDTLVGDDTNMSVRQISQNVVNNSLKWEIIE